MPVPDPGTTLSLSFRRRNGVESAMKEREPGFFTGLYLSDFMGIGIAFLFSLGGFYLLWRMLFGPPLFEPAIQAETSAVLTQERLEAPQPDIHTGPGEVSVGITPPKKKQH
jgi:hypothetical protein